MDSASNVATSLLPYSRQIASLQELTSENKSTQVTFFVTMGSSARYMVFLGQAALSLPLLSHDEKSHATLTTQAARCNSMVTRHP